MLLSALLMAAAVQAAPLPPMVHPRAPVVKSRRVHGSEREMLAALAARRACREPGVQMANNIDAAVVARITPLGDLPPANHTLTVLRSVDGCPVSSTIRFNVDLPAGQ